MKTLKRISRYILSIILALNICACIFLSMLNTGHYWSFIFICTLSCYVLYNINVKTQTNGQEKEKLEKVHRS